MDIRKKEHKLCLFTNLCPGHPWGLALSRDMGGKPNTFPSTRAQPEAHGLQGKLWEPQG